MGFQIRVSNKTRISQKRSWPASCDFGASTQPTMIVNKIPFKTIDNTGDGRAWFTTAVV